VEKGCNNQPVNPYPDALTTLTADGWTEIRVMADPDHSHDWRVHLNARSGEGRHEHRRRHRRGHGARDHPTPGRSIPTATADADADPTRWLSATAYTDRLNGAPTGAGGAVAPVPTTADGGDCQLAVPPFVLWAVSQ